MTLEVNAVQSPLKPRGPAGVLPLVDAQRSEDIGPIEAEMRAELASLRGTAYDDTFDWSVYDRIAKKLETPPRGGVVFNTTFKLVNHHSTCSKCHYAFEIDSYGRGCFHNCAYCYAKDQLTTYGYWNRPQPFPVNLAKVRKVFHTVFETDKSNTWREVMERRVPIRVGSMSDSFMWMDTKYGVTKELLKIFSFYDYPYIIFTRSDLVAHDDYIKLLRKDLCSVQFSISGNNNQLTRAIEPGAPSYQRRLKALAKLSAEKFWTTVRINPLFPMFPDGYFTDNEYFRSRYGDRARAPRLPFYDESFVEELSSAGVPSVLAGFVRLSSKAISNLSKASSVDLKSFFRPEFLEAKGDKRYSDAEIRYYYKWFQQECKKNGVRFSTCYIGNGLKDYFQYQDMWSNASDCCDVVGNLKSFRTTSQSIQWRERHRHAPCKSSSLASERQEIRCEETFAVARPQLEPKQPGAELS